MKSNSLYVFIMTFVLWISLLLVGCDLGNGDNYNQSGIDLPNNEVVLVMKDFLKDVGIDANIKEDTFQWLNYAEYDYNNYTGWYYDITWYSLSITGVKDFPNVNKIFDGWYVHYVWDEIWDSAIDYSKDNILCSYFLSLEQEIPYELMSREWDYDNSEEKKAYDEAWSDFYDIATYSVDLSCGYIPEWVIQFKDFNYYAEWMEPFWNAYIIWDYVTIFTPNGLEEKYIETIKSEWDNFSFKWYDIDWKLEKTECIDGWKWDTHEYKISFDVTKSSYWDDGKQQIEWTSHYEWCADKENIKFTPWEEWTLKSFIKKSWYQYTKDYDQDKVSYAIGNMVGKYMVVNFYYVDGDIYESYQNVMENTGKGFKVIYEWEWYNVSDEECERLNQYDNNLMDMFFFKSCPRG